MKNVSHIYAKAIFLTLVFTINQTASANLITNGGFESGGYIPSSNVSMTLAVGSTAMDGWTVTNDLILWIGPVNPWSLTANEGKFFLDLTDLSTGYPFGGVSQSITTDVGQSYELSFDLGSSNRWGRPSAIEASAADSSSIFTSSTDGGVSDWERFSMVFTADSEITTIFLTGVIGSQYIGLDNVSVVRLVPLPTDDCIATYKTDGSLNIPCVSVPDVFGGTVMYQADMKLIPLSNPFSFELIEAQQIDGISNDTNNCVAIYRANGTLNIPCVSVPDAFGGTVMYEADMELIPFSSPFTFKLIDAQQKNQ